MEIKNVCTYFDFMLDGQSIELHQVNCYMGITHCSHWQVLRTKQKMTCQKYLGTDVEVKVKLNIYYMCENI